MSDGKEEDNGLTADEACWGRWLWQSEQSRQREEASRPEERQEPVLLEFVKCRNCEWIHVLVDQYGGEQCFRCGGSRKNVEPVSMDECPRGSTIQGLLRH